MLKFIPFDEWLERNQDLRDTEDCAYCGGDGTHVCSCGDEHDCGYCDATGKVDGPKALKIYVAECEKARRMLAAAD